MISKYVKGRAAVFIDAANILYSQRTLGWRVDYQKLKEYLKKECDLRKLKSELIFIKKNLEHPEGSPEV